MLAHNLTIEAHIPEKYGTDTGREFDPATETHHFGFVVKAVDPGCTLEVQIEEISGRVTRITTTDSSLHDRAYITAAVNEALERFFKTYGIYGGGNGQ